MQKNLTETFHRIAPKGEFSSLRWVKIQREDLCLRKGILEPSPISFDEGAMITVHHGRGIGYAATADLSQVGLENAIQKASAWAEISDKNPVFDASMLQMPSFQGEYHSDVRISWSSVPFQDKLTLLKDACEAMKKDDRIVEWIALLAFTKTDTHYVTNHGANVRQTFEYLIPDFRVVANNGKNTQIRTFGGRGHCQQGGWERLEQLQFLEKAAITAEEALLLLEAGNCPTETMDLLLAPDQMLLQIHESIGHPLELDRILGDERNYAGTSFVTPDLFGRYQYGSSLLNVTFDPTIACQFASYPFDDSGSKAEKVYIIQDGILQRPLGGNLSQMRTGMQGVANERACSWNRPPIDRMANLNVEPGDLSMEDLVEKVERGVLMRTNTSWSIDDSRNKFQFGCEFGQLIENGRLTRIVKNPNYRGISSNFWRNLIGVGDRSTFSVLGTPHCGKGEPNQAIHVGHASPMCLFRDVAVFGGES